MSRFLRGVNSNALVFEKLAKNPIVEELDNAKDDEGPLRAQSGR